MGGVDRAEQMSGLYDLTMTWCTKIFYTCISTCAVNSWIMYNDMRGKSEKITFLSFLVILAEELIIQGLEKIALSTPKRGPISNKRKLFGNVPVHLPYEG